MKRLWLWSLVILLVGVAAIAGVVASQPYTFHGSTIEPAFTAPDLPLASTRDTQFQIGQERNKTLLVFFGYTFCPDVCPATLGQLRQVMAKLGNQASSVEVLFVTVDPARDTADQLKHYLRPFGPTFIGLTGSEEQLQPVWKAYGVYREIRPGSPTAYTVDHSVRIYLIDPQGRLRLTYTDAAQIDWIAEDIQHVLGGG